MWRCGQITRPEERSSSGSAEEELQEGSDVNRTNLWRTGGGPAAGPAGLDTAAPGGRVPLGGVSGGSQGRIF